MKKMISAWLILIFIGTMLTLPAFATAFTATPVNTIRGPAFNLNTQVVVSGGTGKPINIEETPRVTIGKKWTFMVYMAADNNLDLAAIDDINEMEMVGSTDEVDIVVFLDRWDEEAESGTWIYHIVHDEDPEKIASPAVCEFDELSTGDPSTLRMFVENATTMFPAENYGLILWDHGGGWFGVCWDWTNDDHLDIDEIQNALAGLPKLALIGFDACLMSMIEVAYEFVDLADVMVASEEVEPWDGWPYDMFLADLTENPWWMAKELAEEIVNDYIESYGTDGLLRALVTMAAINLTGLPTLVDLIDELAVYLAGELPHYYGLITQAKSRADRFPFGFGPRGPFIDLYHFVSLLETKDSYLTNLVEEILGTWEDVVIAALSYNKIHKNALGLSIYFPLSAKFGYYPGKYLTVGLDFVEETYWDEFLAAYFG